MTTDSVDTDPSTDFMSITEDSTGCLHECGGLGLGLFDEGTDCLEDAYTDACPPDYFNTGECCLNQWWIIGLSAGAGFVIIVILVSVLAWLAVDRKHLKHGKNKTKSKQSPENGEVVTTTGLDNPGYQGTADDQTSPGNSGDGAVSTLGPLVTRNRPNIDGYSTNADGPPPRPPTPTRSRDFDDIRTDNMSRDGYNPDTPKPGDTHEGEVPMRTNERPSQRYSSQVYEDIPHAEQNMYDNTETYHTDHDVKPGYVVPQQSDYYNVNRDSDPVQETPGDPGHHHEDRALGHNHHDKDSLIPTGVNKANKPAALHHGINMNDYVDFEATLEHVDPTLDYTIKRPQLKL